MRKLGALIAFVGVIGALAVASASATNVERNDTGNKIHWGDGAGGGPGYVTLKDTTGPNWLVRAAATDWNFAGNINVNYEYGDCGGRSRCIKVFSEPFRNYTCRERAGAARVIYPRFFEAHIVVSNPQTNENTELRLNQDCVGGGRFTGNQRRVVVCHEMGHVLGLDHDLPAGHHNTCMAGTGDTLDHPEGPDGWTGRQHDFRTLDNVIYDHRD